MKCKHCNEDLDPSHVSYWRGKKVHPRCFDVLKWRDKHLTPEEWLRTRVKRFGKPKHYLLENVKRKPKDDNTN